MKTLKIMKESTSLRRLIGGKYARKNKILDICLEPQLFLLRKTRGETIQSKHSHSNGENLK